MCSVTFRNTTHVLFSEGKQSTYNKAKKWNIPVVTIFWMEACKSAMRVVNPHLFPIPEADRYEHPENYPKLKVKFDSSPAFARY